MTTSSDDDSLREEIIDLLSDLEVETLQPHELAALTPGEPYIDLERLSHGVQQANGAPRHRGRVLKRTAVDERTWANVVRVLATPPLPERRRPRDARRRTP